jgi:hypothetical protein
VTRLTQETYSRGMARLWAMYRHQSGFPKDPKDQTKPDPQALQDWFNEFTRQRWTDEAFNFCLPRAIQQRGNFSQPIFMLSGDKECNINAFADSRLTKIQERAQEDKQNELDMPTVPEVAALVAGAIKGIDETPSAGLSGSELVARQEKLLQQAQDILKQAEHSGDVPREERE